MTHTSDANRPVNGGGAVPTHCTNSPDQPVPVEIIGGVHITLTPEEAEETTLIDYIHKKVHDGLMYHAEHLILSVGNNASCDLLLTTGAVMPHLVISPNTGGACVFYLYSQDATFNVVGGTPVPVYNMLRSAPAVAGIMAVVHTPTVNNTGTTPIITRFVPGGASQQTRIGGGVRTGTEWILKPNQKYLMRLTNVSGASIAISCALEWYEEDV